MALLQQHSLAAATKQTPPLLLLQDPYPAPARQHQHHLALLLLLPGQRTLTRLQTLLLLPLAAADLAGH
jgi:hypothetical protein